MKHAADFRAIARSALRGKWILSALVAFVASLIGAQIATGGSGSTSINFNTDSGYNIDPESYFSEETLNILLAVFGVLLVVAVIGVIISLIIGGAGKLGYAKYNLNLVDYADARLEDLFSQFHRLGQGFLMNLLMGLYIYLWSLLFVIPGIIKSFSYSMTPYILSEHPEYGVNEAITLSREMMDGNKFRLFCLNLSFIGWSILCGIPAGIAASSLLTGAFYLLPLILVTIVGGYFLNAYMEAAQAAFYREVSGSEAVFANATEVETEINE